MPREPRSCTANSSSARTTVTSPCGSQAVTVSIQLDTGGSWCHRRPSQRATPRRSTTRTAPVGWRCTTVAPSTSASTTRSRSDPDGRSNTIHSSAPSRWRTSQLDSPSANRRIPSGSVERRGPRLISSCVPAAQVSGSVVGTTTAPELTTRARGRGAGGPDRSRPAPARRRDRSGRARARPPRRAPPPGGGGEARSQTSLRRVSSPDRPARLGGPHGLSHPLCQSRGVMSAAPAPPDQAARDRIAHDLGTTLFVEAGAGSGKTTALVGRVVALVTSGTVELRHVAAITFTEKAGAELRDRVRRALQERGRGRRARGRAVPRRARPARRRRHRHAALLRPAAPVGAPGGGAAAPRRSRCSTRCPRRWRSTGAGPGSSTSSSRIPTLERTILLLHAANVDPGKLRSLALAFERSWDLVEDLVPERVRRPARGRRPHAEAPRPSSAALGAARRPSASTRPTSSCLAVARVRRLRRAARAPPAPTTSTCSRRSAALPGYRKNSGKAPSWRGCKDAVLAQLAAVVRDGRGRPPERARRLRPPPRRRAARQDPRGGRAAPGGRHPRVPRPARAGPQGAARPGAGPGRAGRASTSATSGCCSTSSRTPTRSRSSSPCASPPPTPRTADAARAGPTSTSRPGGCSWSATRSSRSTGSAAPTSPCSWRPRERFAPEAGGAVELTANFRTVAPVIDWVNATFRTLLEEPPDDRRPDPSQPAYIDLARRQRPAAAGRPAGGRHRHARRTPTARGADAVRAAESRDVAHVITTRARPRAGRSRRRRRRLAPVPPRRHHHPRARPHLAAVPRGRPRGRRHPVPGRVELARLRHPGRPRPAHGAARRRRPHRPPPHRQRAAHARCSAAATTTCSATRCSTAARWSYNTPTPPDPADGIVSAGPGVPARDPRGPPLALAAPSCSTASPATAAPSSSASPRAGRATCGGGSGS